MGHINKKSWGTVNHGKFLNGIGSETSKFDVSVRDRDNFK